MVSVCVPGPAFSFLLYENAKAEVQQEGFLLGDLIHKEAIVITDSDQQHVKISKIIKINSVVACPHNHYISNTSGRVDETKLRDLLGSLFDKVVGWYSFEKNSESKLLFINKVVHRQLVNLFQVPPDLFLYCMLTRDTSHNGSTHAFTQTFLRRTTCTYENVPLHIPNLSEPNNCYVTPEPCSESFSRILRDQKIESDRANNAIVISRILNTLHQHTNSVIDEVVQAEKYIHELEEEVRILEQQKILKIEQAENQMLAEFDHGHGDSVSQKSEDQLINACSPVPDREKQRQENKESSKENSEPHDNTENENPAEDSEESPLKDSPAEIQHRSGIRGRGRGSKHKASLNTSKKPRSTTKTTDVKN